MGRIGISFCGNSLDSPTPSPHTTKNLQIAALGLSFLTSGKNRSSKLPLFIDNFIVYIEKMKYKCLINKYKYIMAIFQIPNFSSVAFIL